MTIKTINTGVYPNDGTGDDLRTAFQKINENFAELTNFSGISNGANVGSGQGVFAGKNSYTLEFKSLTSTDNSVVLTHTNTTVDLQAVANVESDTNPTLGGNLELNGHNILSENGGDIQSTVFGIDIRSLSKLVELIVYSGSVPIDLGTFLDDAGSSLDIDFGGFVLDLEAVPPLFVYNTNLDFGTFA